MSQLKEAIPAGTEIGTISDGYHTFDELYEHRIVLFIQLCSWIKSNGLGPYVWKSLLHSDGSKFDGWFVAGIGTLPGHQMTYHLPLSKWDECDDLTELPRAPEWDGHTPADVLERLRKL